MSDNQNTRYYWLKLKVNFMTSETVDFLMSQEGGANYIVLYQMLCLKTINTEGRLSRTIGEVIIPFDEYKIQRDCKWFSIDTIRVAMELYKKLGLIYEDADGTLVISDHKGLIGSESPSAERMRRMRNGKKLDALPESTNPSQCDAECDAQGDTTCDRNVTVEIEYRDRDIEIDNNVVRSIDAAEEIRDNVTVNGKAPTAFLQNPEEMKRIAMQLGKAWNLTGFKKVQSFSINSTRGKMIKDLVSVYGMDRVLDGIERAKNSEFLHTLGDRITFDWFLKAENFQKVIEGNYDTCWQRIDRSGGTKSGADRLIEKIARGDYD